MGRLLPVVLGLTLTAVLGTASAAQEQWQYGTHPVLGLSAHVSLDDGGAVGLACAKAQFDPISDGFVAIRITDNLLHDGNFVMLFDGAGDIQTLQGQWAAGGDGYSEWGGNTCMTSVIAFQRANALVSSPARITTFGGWGEDGYADLPERLAIGLRGSSAAINKLIAACPSMRIDIEQNCGI